MDVQVRNLISRPVGIFENYESFIWTERYAGFGEFKLLLPVNAENSKILEQAEYINISQSDRTMFVETIEDVAGVYNVSGRTLESMLERRVVETAGPSQSTSLTDAIFNIMRYNIGGFAQPAVRQVPTLMVSGNVPSWFNDPVSYDSIKPGANLYDSVRDLCLSADLGFQILNEEGSDLFNFRIYFGRDRTLAAGNSPIIFSESSGNIHDVRRLRSSVTHKNVVHVNLPPWKDDIQGPGEIWRVSNTSRPAPEGLARREVWTDASDLRKDESFNATNKPSRAVAWGKQHLPLYPYLNQMDFELAKDSGYNYGRMYLLGDLVSVLDNDGVPFTYRVTEYIRSKGKEGSAEYPTLSRVY